MKAVFILLFLAAAAVNIISCAADRQTSRGVAKVLLMPLLAAVYLLSAPAAEPWVLAALALGWLGDLFLINPNRDVLRVLGIGSFLLGHVFYLAAIFRRFAPHPPLWGCIAAPVVFLAAAALLYLWLYPIIPTGLKAIGAVYYLALAALGTGAGLVFLSGCPGRLPLLLGAVFFLVSDTILCRQFFTVGHPAPRYDVAVMTTYLLAQCLLTASFCL